MNKAERDAAWAIPSPVRAVEDLEHRLHTALNALDARDELLRRLEWSGESQGLSEMCPICWGTKGDPPLGHEKDCALGAILGETP